MLVIGLDSSTTGTKAIAWDAGGRAVAEGRARTPLENPAPDAWEQDAEAWWTGALGALGDCARGLGARVRDVRALAVAHQRETFVLVDEHGAPLGRALVWMDSRGKEQVTAAVEKLGRERLHALSGKPPCITPSLYKLMALFAREPSLLARGPGVFDVHAFLVTRLSGRRATSLASADPMGLVDMQARAWSRELCELAGLDVARLPELVEPGREIGRLQSDVAKLTGLEPGLAVIAGAGDGQAAGLGAGIVAPGRAYLNLGTAIVSGVLCFAYATDLAFRTLYGATPGTHFLETDLKGGTFTLTWLAEKWTRTGGDVGETLASLERDAALIPAGSDGLMVVPYWNGVMNPYWDDAATGITLGWTGRHGPAHLYRAILEGIAFEQRLHTAGVEAATRTRVDEMVVMGGGSKSALWCQILADVLGKRVVRARTREATSLGAAVLASVAAGLHPNLDAAVASMTGTAETFEPGAGRDGYDRLFREVYVHVFPALQRPMTRLGTLTR